MKPRLTIIGIVLTCAALIGAGRCSTPCDEARATSAAICASQGVNSKACQDALSAATQACAPPPTTTTTTTTTTQPDVPPEPPLTCANLDCVVGFHCEMQSGRPVCVKDAPPTSSCPIAPTPGSSTWVDAKPYGQGLDTEPRTDDQAMCRAIYGEGWTGSSCHFEGLPPAQRSACEMQLLGGCPTWQWAPSTSGPWTAARQASHPVLSVDHFGDPVYRDDPQTPTTGHTLETLHGFEGQPLACGLQRDERDDPMAGFFVIAHGRALVRACDANGQHCGECRLPSGGKAPGCEVDH